MQARRNSGRISKTFMKQTKETLISSLRVSMTLMDDSKARSIIRGQTSASTMLVIMSFAF